MGTHVDFKISRQDFTDKGEPRWLVRVYEGAYRAPTAEEVTMGAAKGLTVYERVKVLKEMEVVLPAKSTDADLRAYMNKALTVYAGKMVIPAQITGGPGADPAAAKVPVVVSLKENTVAVIGA